MSEDQVLQALQTLIGEQSHVRGELARMSGEIAGVRGEIAEIRGEIAEIRGEIAEIRGEQARMSGEMSSLNGEMTRLRVDVLDRFERMENKLTLIREDIAVNMGRADTAHRAADNTRDELRALNAQVQAMERRERMLSARLDRLEK